MTTDRARIRVVVFLDGDAWVAQCLEYDICAQGPDPKTVDGRFVATLLAEASESNGRGRKLFENLDPGPDWVAKLWKDDDSGFQRIGSLPSEIGSSMDFEMQLAA